MKKVFKGHGTKLGTNSEKLEKQRLICLTRHCATYFYSDDKVRRKNMNGYLGGTFCEKEMKTSKSIILGQR